MYSNGVYYYIDIGNCGEYDVSYYKIVKILLCKRNHRLKVNF